MEMYHENTQKSSIAGIIVYLLLSFPLGLAYFIITVIGLSVGLGTLVIWVGLPLLTGTLFAVRGMAMVERQLVASLLRTPLPLRSARNREGHRSFLHYVRELVQDRYTWTSLLYMILKLPLGILSFILVLVLPIVSATLTLFPAAYLITLYVNTILLHSGIHSTGELLIPYFIEVHTSFDLSMFLRSFLIVPIGLLLCFISSLVLRGLATGSAELARALLDPGEATGTVKQAHEPEIPALYGYYEAQPAMYQER